jgi:hypothetical protein
LKEFKKKGLTGAIFNSEAHVVDKINTNKKGEM